MGDPQGRVTKTSWSEYLFRKNPLQTPVLLLEHEKMWVEWKKVQKKNVRRNQENIKQWKRVVEKGRRHIEVWEEFKKPSKEETVHCDDTEEKEKVMSNNLQRVEHLGHPWRRCTRTNH